MSMDETIKRINELSRKMKAIGLSEEELKEQQQLRRKYINAFKASLRTQLDSIKYVDDDRGDA
jgi:uncharacterized protein YnzC (UPF0291/DUF896 family)